MKEISKTYAIILLIIMIAIGGIVLYGKNRGPEITRKVPPLIKGPSTPPPGYAAPR